MTNYEYVKRWRKNNPDKVAEQSKRYATKHPENLKRNSVTFRQRHLLELRAKEKEAARKRRQTPEYKEQQKIRNIRYKQKLIQKREEAAGRAKPSTCELCGTKEFVSNVGRIVFDHSHKNNKFRGWICDRCNKVLGLVYDEPNLLRSMANYLEANNG